MNNCTDCILDLTDACPRGAGRSVDDEICDSFFPSNNKWDDAIERKVMEKEYLRGWQDGEREGFDNAVGRIAEIMSKTSVEQKIKEAWKEYFERMIREGDDLK